MKIVHFTEKNIGSFDWELPKVLAERIEKLPKEVQEVLMEQISMEFRGHLHLLLCVLNLGQYTPDGLRKLNEQGLKASQEIGQLITSIKNDRSWTQAWKGRVCGLFYLIERYCSIFLWLPSTKTFGTRYFLFLYSNTSGLVYDSPEVVRLSYSDS